MTSQQFQCTTAFIHPQVALPALCKMQFARRLRFGDSCSAGNILVKSLLAPFSHSTGICFSSLHGYVQRVDECNSNMAKITEFFPFTVDEKIVGYVHERIVSQISHFKDIFVVESRSATRSLYLTDSLLSLEDRSEAMALVVNSLHKSGVVTGIRNELFPVASSFGVPPVLLIERAAAALFGAKVYGVHMNGFKRNAEGKIYLWAARRSMTKETFPGKLDHLVAGGLPHGISCIDNMIKECEEEAGIPSSLASKARPVSLVSYNSVVGQTVKRDVLFCYDLELPEDFQPRNIDGEVQSFSLLPIEEVARIVSTSSEYKTNCNLVLIDFFVRHGYLNPDQEGYLDLVLSLRKSSCH